MAGAGVLLTLSPAAAQAQTNTAANGYQALTANTASQNTSTGYLTLTANTTGSNNIAEGYESLFNNVTGSYDTAVGYFAGWNITSGNQAGTKELKAANARLAATVAKQQQDLNAALSKIKDLTAGLKEQASVLQKVSAQLQLMRSTPQVVSNNN